MTLTPTNHAEFPAKGRVMPFVVLLTFAYAASAHHSFAMFDFKREVTLAGTVKEFQWTNPHCFIQILVPKSGGTEEWSIEMSSPLHLLQNGWKPGTLRVGDQVTLVIHPMHDGSRGGNYVRATASDGSPIDPSAGKTQVAQAGRS